MAEGVSAYAWWPDGLAKGVTLPNGLAERRCYDEAGRLSRIVLGKGSVSDACVATSPITELDYEYDGNGNRLLQKERRTSPSSQLLGEVERTEYGYDNLDRLVGVRYPDETATLYRLDEVGNRVGEKRAASSKVLALTVAAFAALAPADATADMQATFNRADWLLSLKDTKDASRNVAYAYDLNGNVVRKSTAAGEREFRWDCRDTLTAVVENGAVLGRYDYDRNLQRTKRITASENVEYVLDDKFVLLEADGSQAGHPATRRYHYGTGPLAVASAGATSFLSNDALGSVTDATSTTGAVTSARQYDAWGRYRNGTAPSGTEPKLGYTGHQFDPETGLVYARARYYDPDTGRFLSRDRFEGSLEDAPSLHRYVYANGNPLVWIDPTGNAGVRTELDRYTEAAIASGDTVGMALAAAGDALWKAMDVLSFGTTAKLDSIHDKRDAGAYGGAAGESQYLRDVTATAGVGVVKVVVGGVIAKTFQVGRAATTVLGRIGQNMAVGGASGAAANLVGQTAEAAAGLRDEFSVEEFGRDVATGASLGAAGTVIAEGAAAALPAVRRGLSSISSRLRSQPAAADDLATSVVEAGNVSAAKVRGMTLRSPGASTSIELPRSPELGATTTMDELLVNRLIPGREGVILDQRTVRYAGGVPQSV